MVEGISSSNLIVQQKLLNNTQNGVINYSQTQINQQPQVDTVELSNNKSKKKISNTQKIFISTGIITASLAGLMFGIRKLNTNTISKIEKNFKKLYANIPEVQNKFKQVFIKDNLSEKETLDILKRYEQIEKQGLSQTKEEYFQAVFEEAKRNYGLGDNIKLVLEKIESKANGFWHYSDGTVHIDPSKNSRSFGFEAIHHELRHAKQFEAIKKYAYDMELSNATLKGMFKWLEEKFPDIYKKVANGRDLDTLIKETSANPDIWKLLDEYESSFRHLNGFDKSENKIFTYCTDAERANVTSGKIQYGRKMYKGREDYVSSDKNVKAYKENPLEQDAYPAGETMGKIIGNHPLDGILEFLKLKPVN